MSLIQKFKNKAIQSLALLILLTMTAHAREKIIITGSSTIAPVMSDLAKSYEKDRDIRIDVQTGGSSRGILDAKKELAQIGMVSRSLKKSESDINGFVIAKDGLAIIVHKSNAVKELSSEQIKNIYLGKIKNWKEVGGLDLPIVVVNKAEGRSTLELFLKFFKLQNSDIKASIIIGDNEQGIKTVIKNKNAIAYVSIGAAEYNASVGAPLKLLSYKGIAANVKNVENGSYPLMRDLTVVTKSMPKGAVDGFIKFLLSEKSKPIIEAHYFVPTSKQ